MQSRHFIRVVISLQFLLEQDLGETQGYFMLSLISSSFEPKLLKLHGPMVLMKIIKCHVFALHISLLFSNGQGLILSLLHLRNLVQPSFHHLQKIKILFFLHVGCFMSLCCRYSRVIFSPLCLENCFAFYIFEIEDTLDKITQICTKFG